MFDTQEVSAHFNQVSEGNSVFESKIDNFFNYNRAAVRKKTLTGVDLVLCKNDEFDVDLYVDSIASRPDKNNTIVESFDQIEREAYSVAAVLAQAFIDSTPSPLFGKKSKTPIFASHIPHAMDAFDFMSSSRMDIYAETIGIDPEVVRGQWKRLHKEWAAVSGLEVTINMLDQIVKILSLFSSGNVHLDAKVFIHGHEIKYWQGVSGLSISDMHNYLRNGLNLKSRVHANLATEEEKIQFLASNKKSINQLPNIT